MKVVIDADGCPVVAVTTQLCKKFHIPCTIVCDTAHQFRIDDVKVITVDKGSDSADYTIANKVVSEDLVITQDYGLASMCLARSARVLHQDGWEYTQYNIDALLLQRHESYKHRASGKRIKGPKKRTSNQDQAFAEALQTILQGYVSGDSR